MKSLDFNATQTIYASEMVGGTGIEPVTPCVSSKCSTAELTALFKGIFSFKRFFLKNQALVNIQSVS